MLKDKVLEIAKAELGKCEIPKGSNWGPDVQKYLSSVGIGFPASWCMAFVYWCTGGAADTLRLQNPLYRTGGVMNQWYHLNPTMRHHDPLAGDIFIMEFAHGLGHTGFVESVQGDSVHTIEGNTNEDGSREGYEVARRVRKISSIKGFIRLNN